MTTANLNKRKYTIPGYYYNENIGNGLTGKDVIIPPLKGNNVNISVSIIAGTNTGKMQFTTSPDAKVAEGTANWQDWQPGDITGSQSVIVDSAVSGIRGVSVSGDISIEIMI